MTIEEILKEKIEDLNVDDLIRAEIHNLSYAESINKIRDEISNFVGAAVTKEINSFMDKEIETDDGWGRKNKYANFEDLFKSEFKKRLDGSYEMKSQIEKIAKNRVEELFNAKKKEVIEKVVSELI